jgi:serine O-acetyltransferase
MSRMSDAVSQAAARLVASIDTEPGTTHLCPAARIADGRAGRLDWTGIAEMVEVSRRLMFPGFFGDREVDRALLESEVGELTARLGSAVQRLVRSLEGYSRDSSRHPCDEIAAAFLSRLADVRRLLVLDVKAAFAGDPAAEHTDEIIWCYPGLDAIFAHRIAHELYTLDVPILPRMIAEQAHSRTGIDIHPGARIGQSFFIDHGSGVVIGETSVIGAHVKIYQGVTLGAKSFPRDASGNIIRGAKRHPTIGDRVAIYAGAVILGGDTVIGDDCVIAGGVFVTSSVPPGHTVMQPRAQVQLRPLRSGGADDGMWGDGI